MNIGVFRATIAHEEIMKLDDLELSYLLSAGRIVNDLNHFSRLIMAHHNGMHVSDSTESEAQVVLLYSTLTLLAGKCWEAWLLVQRSSALWNPEKHLIGQTTIDCLDQLRAQFDIRVLKAVRDRSAFHYDNGELATLELFAFRSKPRNSKVDFLLGHQTGNNLYIFSAENHIFAILDKFFPNSDRLEQLRNLERSVMKSTRLLGVFIGKSISDIMISRIGKHNISLTSVDMEDRPGFGESRLAFIVRLDKSDAELNGPFHAS
ncbi:MAG: hypothetical protein SFW09_07540 [Hyphomicrobiaceae bacterium]|nr:hypothetical protein [Hyphomicrobiaceae bacterium]